MKKIANILRGWGKSIGILQVSVAEDKLSELRIKICSGCPFAEKSRILKLLNGEARYENELKCMKCGCPVRQKSLVIDEQCPIQKW